MAGRAPRVLVAPFDVGLGHATRCVPIVRALRAAGAVVVLGAAGRSRAFLAHAFPGEPVLELPAYDVTYQRRGSLLVRLLAQGPRVVMRARAERAVVERLARGHRIDVVISDGRFGCRATGCRNVYMSHQLRILIRGGIGPIVTRLHRAVMRSFDEVWVPDLPDEPNVSGAIGHDRLAHRALHYVGPLSRFVEDAAGARDGVEPGRVLAMVSGPEPQREIFERMVSDALGSTTCQATIAAGRPDAPEDVTLRPGLRRVHHLDDRALARELARAAVVVTRSGYSTLCDTAPFGKRLLLVPTPGQPEQGYLARRLGARGCAAVQRQARFGLESGLAAAAESEPFALDRARGLELLRRRVEAIVG